MMNKTNGHGGIPVDLFQILKDDAMKVLHSICQQIWKTQQWPQVWERSVFIPVPKTGNIKECSTYCTIALISAVATGLEKVSFHSNPKDRQYQRMFKLLHNCTHLTCQQNNAQNSPSQLHQYMNPELLNIQAGFRKGRGTRDQIANICWIIKKAREFQKNICFIDYAKAFDFADHNKLWKILQEMGIPDHLT